MKITIIPSDEIVIIDRVGRRINMSGIDPQIHAVQFDTVKGSGEVEFKLDLDPRPNNERITDIIPFQVFLDRWTAAAPQPPAPPTPEELAEIARRESLRSAIDGDGIIQNLRTMTAAQFDAWWDANVTNAAQAITVLKRLVKLIIFRLL